MSKNYFVLFILIVCINYNIKAQKCGVPKIGRGNIIGGEFVIHGQFPWYVARNFLKLFQLKSKYFVESQIFQPNSNYFDSSHFF